MNDMDVQALREQVTHLETSVAQLTELVTELRVEIKEVKMEVKFRSCPNPGSCVELSKDVRKMDSTVTLLKSAHDQRTGERTIIMLVGSVVGALSGFLFSYLTRK